MSQGTHARSSLVSRDRHAGWPVAGSVITSIARRIRVADTKLKSFFFVVTRPEI